MTQDRAAFAGQIADVPVVELLQTILQGRHTGVARFDTPSGAATLWFRDGALVDADMGRHHMEAAVQRLLALEDGAFEIEFKPINRRQVIKLGTADLIAQAPGHGANEDTDPRSKRGGRRQGVSWHPTGGGRGRSADVSSGAVPIVAAPDAKSQPIATSSGAVPIVVPPSSSGAVPIVPMPASSSAPIASVPMTVVTASGTAVPIAVSPSASAPVSITPAPANGAGEPEPSTRGRTMFGVPGLGTPPTIAPLPAAPTPTNGASPIAPDSPQTAMSPSATMVGAARVGLEATIPPLVASAAARRLEGAKDEVVLEIPDVEDRTWMRPFAPPVTQAVPGDPTPLPRAPTPTEPGRPTTPPTPKTEVPVAVPAEPVRAADATVRPREPARGVTAMFFPPPRALGPAPTPAAEWPELPETTEKTTPPVDEEDKTVRDDSRTARNQTVIGPAVVRGGPAPTPTWEPPSDRTMTAGSLVRSPASPVARPGGARRGDARVADIAQAIGLQPLPALAQDPREVADGVRLDQQVEAARAAGLTGASAPALVGRYEVLLRIARGGMGTVYLARITGEGGFRRLFALKVIRDHLSQNDEYVRMLLQEARIASRLHHPNVVGIVDIGTLANQHYLVMDYVEGCTFSELLKVHRRTRPPHLVIPIILDALTGLHAAHTLVDDDGVPLTLVHCDFSPQNMLLGTNGICRITDFGIARATTAWNERSSITRGKPAYVSPEQVIGRPLDRRSDVFSAGVVLWNALTGEQLFDGDTPERTLNAVLNKPIPPPSTVGLRPPSCFDRVCLRALQRDPDRRYQSAEEMLIELRRIAIGEDYLAPSSEVAQWVIDTFGRQLELRRQAAGISNRGLNDSQPVLAALAVPEISFAPVRTSEQTVETNVLPGDYPSNPSYGTTPIDDSHPSRTALMRADVAYDVPTPLATSRARAFVLGIAVTIATTAIAVAIAKPEWIGGGAVDDYGRYVAPAAGTSAVPGDDEKEPRPEVDDTKLVVEPSDAKTEAKIDDAKIEPPKPVEPPPEIAVPDPVPEVLPQPEKRPRKTPVDAKAEERRLKKKKPPEETPPTEEAKSDPPPEEKGDTKAPPPPDPPPRGHAPPVDPFATEPK